jgi:transcriptional regulator with XRE-family HTH domain
MGLIEPDVSGGRGLDAGTVRHLATHVRQAGIASGAAAALNNVETPSGEELASLLRTMIAALDASPVPKFEWSGLARTLDTEQLASLLDVSLSSLNRYQSGERDTPDPIAARLHFLALVIGDLAGSYNDVGIRRWFGRKRTALGGRTPAQLLTGDWDPEDAGPARVRGLARELVTMSVT